MSDITFNKGDVLCAISHKEDGDPDNRWEVVSLPVEDGQAIMVTTETGGDYAYGIRRLDRYTDTTHYVPIGLMEKLFEKITV